MYRWIAAAVLTAALTVFVPPSFAAGPDSPRGKGQGSEQAAPAPAAAPEGKAYGHYCRTESKKHVKGEKGTPFSRCVTAMAKLGKGKADSPRAACKGQSKKHVKGEKGTPFSRCVSAAAKLLADREADDEAGDESATEETTEATSAA